MFWFARFLRDLFEDQVYTIEEVIEASEWFQPGQEYRFKMDHVLNYVELKVISSRLFETRSDIYCALERDPENYSILLCKIFKSSV